MPASLTSSDAGQTGGAGAGADTGVTASLGTKHSKDDKTQAVGLCTGAIHLIGEPVQRSGQG